MEAKEAIAFIPEFEFSDSLNKKIKLTDDIYLLPKENSMVIDFRTELQSIGYETKGGSYLYFNGKIKEDGTLYEIFQGYALALTFFNHKGRAMCKALREKDDCIELFTDEYDKLRYEKDDVIKIKLSQIKKVKSIYSRVEKELQNKNFNPLRNSLEFFILFLNEKQIRTRLLYLSICLESLLLEGENEGLSYKLGIRCANLLNVFYKGVDKESTFNEIKNSYDLRSKIIHGDDYKKSSINIINKSKGRKTTELDHVLILESLVKDTLSVVFSIKDLYDYSIKNNLGKIIDQKYILGCE